MRISDMVIAILLFSGVMIGGSIFMTDLANTYSVDVNTTLSTFNKTNETYQIVEDVASKLEVSSVTGIDAIDIAIYFIRGAYEGLKLTLQVPDMMKGMVTDTIKIMGLPSWISLLVVAIITTVIVFAVISAALKWRV